MIITCKNCSKNFNVDPNVIPEKGRLLQCNNCDHKWHYTKEVINKIVLLPKTNKPSNVVEPIVPEPNLVRDVHTPNIELLDNQIKEDFVAEKISTNKDKTNKWEYENSDIKIPKNRKNYNILGLIIVFIISFIALIIFLDTLQNPISKIFPNIEFILYNLYETFNDINLFLRDLI
mgnify:CR=1 FL=1|tara:strand:+ start:48 stop:572 length:525 start_codon:yes stop_codon:yes gene_type:complete